MFRLLQPPKSGWVKIFLDGQPVSVPEEISVAAAIMYLNTGHTRRTPVSLSPRTPFCMMGVCFECLMEIDEKPNQRTCQVTVQNGMKVKRQPGVDQPGLD